MVQNNQKHILILYGSTTGNSQRLAKYLKNKIHNYLNNNNIKYKATILNVAEISYPFLLADNYELTIICTSTWGIEPALLQEDMEYWCVNTNTYSLNNKSFVLFVLGDNTYPHFAFGYEILCQYLEKHSGIINHNFSAKIQDPWEDSQNIIDNIINKIINF